MATRKPSTTSRKRSTTKYVPVPTVIARVAEKRGIDTTKAGKAVRSRLRAHFDDNRKRFNYPAKGDAKQKANDQNRWPAMPSKLADTFTK